MNITKLGHCCLLIEHNNKRIVTDPGGFSEGVTELRDIDLVLITHEHGDHIHTESLQSLLANNPQAVVVTNSGVGALLDEAGIPYELLEGTNVGEYAELFIEAFDGEHEEIFADFMQVQNTGYFIDNTLFYPGDAYIQPGKAVPVLALPVAGPWCKLADALHYAIAIAPGTVIPVHDGLLNEAGLELTHQLCGNVLQEKGIAFKALRNNEQVDME